MVRSCKTSTTTTSQRENANYFPNFESLSFGNNESLTPQTLENTNEPFQEFLLNNSPSPPTTTSVLHPQSLQQGEQFYPSTISFPLVNPQPLRPRRRKNQESKVVRQMTQDQLSSDSWAWRKYGQKPIKGSPYPRSYYRCSTSKGCGARKQVERSSTDPSIYFVSYTGDHTHPRPTHRSSLAGSTRTKFSNSVLSNHSEAKKAASSSSSPVASASSFSPSPTTPLVDGEENDDDDDDEDDDDVLIPNLVMDEDVLSRLFSPP